MFEAISGAQKSIYLEMYIFQNTIPDFDFFSLLKDKAKKGLRVRVILDSLGSISLKNSAVDELKDSGVEVLSLSYLLHRMHRKVLIVDEEVAFIGGVNIYKISRFWNDLTVRMRGRLVSKVVMSFAKAYINAGGKDPLLLGRNVRTDSRLNAQVVEHNPVGKKFHFKKIYLKYLKESEKSITLITPYFLPKRWLGGALHQAVLRGVDVEILMPKNADHFAYNRVNYFYIYRFSKLGIKFYMQNQMNHGKAMIIDGREAMIGSQNLDFFSFDFNSEVGVVFKDSKAVAELSAIAEEWKKGAVLFDPEIQKPKWFDYILSPIISLFGFIFRIF